MNKAKKNLHYSLLPYTEYEQLIELLEDYEDLLELNKSIEENKGKKDYTLDEMKKAFNIK